MNNYQLNRTNVLLGGQMKWDLTLDSVDSKLQIKDFHLSPISSWVPFNKLTDESLLNYHHKDNIRDFYNRVGNYFYVESTNPRLQLKQPIIAEEKLDTYNDIYDTGLSRVSYKLTGKSFQYFCPLWLEDFGIDDKLKFELVFRSRTINDDGSFSFTDYISKSFVLENSILYEDYHNKFSDYFYEYINYISSDSKIGDNIINVDFRNNFLSIDGVDVRSGDARTVNSSYVVSNLYSRERPLMEFDKILIDNISNNNLIVKQLFNFNFLFNIEDVINRTVVEMLYGDFINIAVRVYVSHSGGEYELLKTTNFDTNYEFIDKRDGSFTKREGRKRGSNVLDYLKDYKCIDLIDKNKICQDIIHWSLKGDTKSYFNVYRGFENHPMLIQDRVNLWSDGRDERGKDKPQLTDGDYAALDWCRWNTVDLSNISDYLIQSNVPLDDSDVHPYLSYIDLSKPYIRGNKMKSGREDNELSPISVGILRAFSNEVGLNESKQLLKTAVDVITNGLNDVLFDLSSISKEIDGLYIYTYDFKSKDKILIINVNNTSDKNDRALMYKNFKELLNSLLKNDYVSNIENTLNTLYAYLNNIEEPIIINVEKGLSLVKANSPSYTSDEIEYDRDNSINQYHLRYDGRILPRFVDELTAYRIKPISRNEYIKHWNQFQEFLPLYPSCDYFYLETTDEKMSLRDNGECRWFDKSTYLIVDTDDTVVISHNQQSDPKSLDDIVKSYLYNRYKKRIDERVKKKMKSSNEDEESLRKKEIDYIFDLYDYSSDYEYENLTDTNNYLYTLKITLK